VRKLEHGVNLSKKTRRASIDIDIDTVQLQRRRRRSRATLAVAAVQEFFFDVERPGKERFLRL